MLSEFKDFIAKGNVMDMAVGIIIGAAFTAIVGSLVADLINPIIGLCDGRCGLCEPMLIAVLSGDCGRRVHRWKRHARAVRLCLPTVASSWRSSTS